MHALAHNQLTFDSICTNMTDLDLTDSKLPAVLKERHLELVASWLLEEWAATEDDLVRDTDTSYTRGTTRFGRQQKRFWLEHLSGRHPWLRVLNNSLDIVFEIHGIPCRFSNDNAESPRKRAVVQVHQHQILFLEEAAPGEAARFVFVLDCGFDESSEPRVVLLGFSAGMPNLLIFDTLSAWLREAGMTLEVIGFFALATLTYALKFVWAPLVDRTTIPFLTKWLGHRRSWMLVTQAVVILGLWLIAGSNPVSMLGAMAAFAVLVGFFGATQDIVIDAWRIEAADDTRQGAMAAAYQWGYRVAMIVAGAAPLVLAEMYNWNLSYAVMAALMGFGVLGVLMAPREQAHLVEFFARGAQCVRPGPPDGEQRQGDVLLGADEGQQVVKLKDETHALAAEAGELRLAGALEGNAVHRHRALGRALDSAEQMEQG